MAKIKILILGSKGMLATQLARLALKGKEFEGLFEVVGWDVDDVNIADYNKLYQMVRQLKPDWIINCAAYNNVDKAEQEKELALAVNHIGPANIIKIGSKIEIPIVHFGTDYVLPGDQKDGYTEDYMSTNPVNFYGQTKLMGEQAILNHGWPKFYHCRVSGLYGTGPEFGNFVNKILQLAQERVKTGEPLKVVADQFLSFAYTHDVAEKLIEMILKGYSFGIYHLVNEGIHSWHEHAKRAVELKKIPVEVVPITTAEYKQMFPNSANRPQYSGWLNTKLPRLRHWEVALAEYLSTF